MQEIDSQIIQYTDSTTYAPVQQKYLNKPTRILPTLEGSILLFSIY
jgi:hypothetical protein